MTDRIKTHRRKEGLRILGNIVLILGSTVMIPLCVVLIMVGLTGCTALMNRTPITETAVLPTSQSIAYQRATAALVQMGATITASDPTSGLLSAQVKNAIVLNVQVQPHTQGTHVTATGSLMHDKFVIGKVDEVDTYMTLLKALP